LLIDNRIAVGDFFQLLCSTALSVVWTHFWGLFRNELHVSKTNVPSQEHLTGVIVLCLFHLNYREVVS